MQVALTQMMEKLPVRAIAAKHRDIRMKRYRALIKDFLNEIVNRSHCFQRKFSGSKGRHRVYGIIRLIDRESGRAGTGACEG